ncbi:zf-HC2 domain-containing protein [Yoonia sp.]|uniref:zf-HC2 domain-containing protein n=1 Tax=Yoonia sp. TaxID=2212373 RepID=UPI0019EC992A|nr:zf-HC2 domain-containing protein [Yoonia sp.]MBE0414544.1 zf-HC2 domain-containing protein [Yoonia sp.]
MLSCKDVADRASALIDGELSVWDTLQIRLHLAMCKGCSRFIAQMRATDQLTAQVAGVQESLQHEADDGRLTEILSTLRKEQSRR